MVLGTNPTNKHKKFSRDTFSFATQKTVILVLHYQSLKYAKVYLYSDSSNTAQKNPHLYLLLGSDRLGGCSGGGGAAAAVPP